MQALLQAGVALLHGLVVDVLYGAGGFLQRLSRLSAQWLGILTIVLIHRDIQVVLPDVFREQLLVVTVTLLARFLHPTLAFGECSLIPDAYLVTAA